MNWTGRLLVLSSLGLLAFGAQAQTEPTIVILPEDAADQADLVTADIVLPDAAAEGMATAAASRGGDGAAGDGADNAADGLAEAQANAAEAAADGLQTALDAAEGARGDIGRANMPDGLPEQVPTDLPAVPDDTVPGDVDLPTPPAPPTPPIGG
jgi:hypothetical protein